MKKQLVDVLLVEDNTGDIKLLKHMLQEVASDNVALTCVTRLAQALSCLNEIRFDLILLDLGLPDSSGLDTLVKLIPHISHIPIFVLTGVDDEALGEAAIEAGAQDYLVKGQIAGPRLWRMMRYAIERNRLLIENKKAERLRIVYETAGAAAHAINQPLTSVIGYSELMLESLPPNFQFRSELTKIRESGLMIQDIVKKMQNIKHYVTKPYLRDIHIVDLDASSEVLVGKE